MAEQRIDPEAMFKSLNGFEEIAIAEVFRTPEEGDPVPLMRALLFVEAKRDGAKSGEAFRSVMNMRVDDVVARFQETETEESTEGKG